MPFLSPPEEKREQKRGVRQRSRLHLEPARKGKRPEGKRALTAPLHRFRLVATHEAEVGRGGKISEKKRKRKAEGDCVTVFASFLMSMQVGREGGELEKEGTMRASYPCRTKKKGRKKRKRDDERGPNGSSFPRSRPGNGEGFKKKGAKVSFIRTRKLSRPEKKKEKGKKEDGW